MAKTNKPSAKNPRKNKAGSQSQPKSQDAKNVRVSIYLTPELYGQYQREARDHAMPVASMLAWALKEWAKANFPDVEEVDCDEAKAARLHSALLDMFPDLAKGKK